MGAYAIMLLAILAPIAHAASIEEVAQLAHSYSRDQAAYAIDGELRFLFTSGQSGAFENWDILATNLATGITVVESAVPDGASIHRGVLLERDGEWALLVERAGSGDLADATCKTGCIQLYGYVPGEDPVLRTALPLTGLFGATWEPSGPSPCVDSCILFTADDPSRLEADMTLAALDPDTFAVAMLTSGQDQPAGHGPFFSGWRIVDGILYALDGGPNKDTSLVTYDIASDAWSATPLDPPTRFWVSSLIYANDHLYAIGGYNQNGASSTIREIAGNGAVTRSWDMLPQGRTNMALANVDGQVAIVGGYDDATAQEFDEVLVFDPSNQPPDGRIIVPSESPTAGRPTTFSATGSDSDGTIASYQWTFGDGGTAAGAQVSHTYSSAGTYTVSVTVTDDEGATASDSVQVEASDPQPPPPPPPPPEPNQAPSASFSASGGVLSASFDASASADSDGDSLSYSWDFGDGSTGSGRRPSHDYAAAGSYTVELTVSDGEDSDSATRSVMVSAPVAPIAAFSLSATSIVEGQSVTADASITTDGSGSNTYAWLLDGEAKGGGKTKSFSPGVGTHTIELVVTNSYDQESRDSASLTVTAKPAPAPQPVSEPEPEPVLDAPANDQESPLGFLVAPALLAAALALRRR